MGHFELSERWCNWKDLDAIDEEFDPFTVDTLQEAREYLLRNPRIMSMDIILSHIDDR